MKEVVKKTTVCKGFIDNIFYLFAVYLKVTRLFYAIYRRLVLIKFYNINI